VLENFPDFTGVKSNQIVHRRDVSKIPKPVAYESGETVFFKSEEEGCNVIEKISLNKKIVFGDNARWIGIGVNGEERTIREDKLLKIKEEQLDLAVGDMVYAQYRLEDGTFTELYYEGRVTSVPRRVTKVSKVTVEFSSTRDQSIEKQVFYTFLNLSLTCVLDYPKNTG